MVEVGLIGALLALKRERDALAPFLEREHPELARAIDAVLTTWKGCT